MIKNLPFLILLSAISFATNAACNSEENFTNRLFVTGIGKTKVIANIAEVRVSTELKNSKANALQDNLAKLSKKVTNALKNGKAKKVETEQIFITPNYSRNDPQTLLGYSGRISISFEAEAKHAGKLISDSIKSGANKIDGIWLKPSKDVKDKANHIALQLASKDALKKAETILDSLNLTQTTVKLIRANSRPNFTFQTRSAGSSFMKMASDSFVPEVTEKEQEIEAVIDLTVGYE